MKKLLLVLLAVGFTLGLSSCENGKDKKQTDQEERTERKW